LFKASGFAFALLTAARIHQGKTGEIVVKRLSSGGGWAAIRYTLRMANRVGWLRLWRALSTRNACKTCALGMGGQLGGMRNEAGYWPEVCKKSLQAMVADMQEGIRPEFFARYRLDQMRTLSPRELEYCGRLTQPLFAGPDDTHYRPIDWGAALGLLAGQLRQAGPTRTFVYASGRSSNEAGFLLQLFARLFGTNFVNNCSYYCHQASGVGLNQAIGTGTATVSFEDVEHADTFFLLGGNPASNHPRLMTSLKNLRRRGGHVVVINPVKEIGLVNFRVPSDPISLLFGSKIASLYVQPHVGGDIALLTGAAKLILERGAIDHGFIEAATEGFDAFRALVEATPWDEIERRSGVSRGEIVRIADVYCAAKHAIFGWTMGITHHTHGVENVRAIVNLALLRGMVGRPRAGLLPIRGHSNVQGIGSMGFTPRLKQEIFDNLEAALSLRLPTSPGLDTMACMQAAERGELTTALCLGGNLYGSNPDAAFAGRALNRLDFIAYLSTTLNTGHFHGRGKQTLILPVLARDEDCEKTTQESMFNFVRLSDGGLPRHNGPRAESRVVAELAATVLGDVGGIDWSKMMRHAEIRRFIARVVPGYERIADLDRGGKEFHVGGRILHTERFPTPSGRARFAAVPLPPARPKGELRLMTVRSEGQFNTVVYEEEDIYRGQDRRDVILLNQADLDRLGLKVDQRVTVRSAAGEMRGIHVRAYDIRAGNALMYYPEANVLVPTTVDPQSRTPAFKSVAITVEPEGENDLSEAPGKRLALPTVRRA
jgi:molybdopterin-dependent oxidoreductase alpha subunit